MKEWYAWDVLAWRKHTRLLNHLQKSCYRDLIDEYMLSGGALPDDDAYLARFLCLTLEEWLRDAAPQVKPYFKPKKGMLHHDRCELELSIQRGRKRDASASASRAAKIRWEKEKQKQEDECDPHADRICADMPQDRTGQDRTIPDSPITRTNARADGETFTCEDALAAIGTQHDPNWQVRAFTIWNGWITQGATPALIMRVIEGVMAKRDKPPGNMLYFKPAVEQAMAQEKALKLNPNAKVEPHAQRDHRSARRRTSDARMEAFAVTRDALIRQRDHGGQDPGKSD